MTTITDPRNEEETMSPSGHPPVPVVTPVVTGHRTIHSARDEFPIPLNRPYGADFVDVMRIMRDAEAHYRNATGLEASRDVPANAIRFTPGTTGEVVVHYTIEEPPR